MPLSRSRDYLSIGEVLESIRSDFPDISISKIRFLEAEGLINPERTGSGYRKFFEDDLARLRYILALQRDQFLPLRVIRERLEEADANGGVAPEPPSRPTTDSTRAKQAVSSAPTEVQMTGKELGEASGLSEGDLAGLQDFGLVSGDGTYDGNDLIVARAARRLFDYGIEPRHLRMFRQWAEREAAFIEQIVGPVTKRRGADAQEEASQSRAELVNLIRQLTDALLRASLRQLS